MPRGGPNLGKIAYVISVVLPPRSSALCAMRHPPCRTRKGPLGPIGGRDFP
jgi:hypothetical protein